jgi:hypothetical protein
VVLDEGRSCFEGAWDVWKSAAPRLMFVKPSPPDIMNVLGFADDLGDWGVGGDLATNEM